MNSYQIDLLIDQLWNAENKDEMRRLLSESASQKNFRLYHELQEHPRVLSTSEVILKITIKNILYVKAERQYSHFYLVNEPYETIMQSHNLHGYEKELTSYGFHRISREHLVNLLQIKLIKPHYTHLLLPKEIQLYVPPSHRKELEERWRRENEVRVEALLMTV